jgi:hypothetical protein
MLPREPEPPDLPSGEESNEAMEIPAFAAGGRVEETGLALIHEGEWIVPAPGSQAVISSGMQHEGEFGQIINYYFPVEIEIVGSLGQGEVERVAQYVFDALEAELSSRI